jgi:hypothetical protein
LVKKVKWSFFRKDFYLNYYFEGQKLDQAAELYETRESFVDFKSGDRLTFKELKQKVAGCLL